MAAVASHHTPSGLQDSLTAAREAQTYLYTRLSSTSSTPSFRAIPTIDLTRSFSSSLAERQAVAAEITEACTSVGFFFITGHGIPTAVCEDVITLAKRFFHELSQESKDAIHLKENKYFRGYEPASYTSVDTDFTSKETKEAFNWGYEAGLDPSGGDGKYVELDGSRDPQANQWPKEDEVPGFYSGISKYYGQVRTHPRPVLWTLY